ncbi:MAG: tetratricopeptide repeat protein [Deltaproteobacteria bacterium]|nr:tetratricopeptide repeat protein [Deltaproteobacteria bacterium]
MTDRKDSSFHFQEVREGIRFFDYAWVFLTQRTPGFFWPLGLPLVVIGFWRLIKVKASLAISLSLITLTNLLFFIRWVLTSAFLPTYFCLAIFWGIGLAWLLRRLRLPAISNHAATKAALTVILCLVFAGGVWLQFPTQNRSGSFLPLELFREDYEVMAPDAISLTAILWFHHRAYQDVFRHREDVVVMGLSDFVRPDYFNPVTQDRFPRVAVPPGGYSPDNGVEYLKKFVAVNLDQNRDIYWEPISMNEIFYPNLAPELNILFKFTRQPIKKLPLDTVQQGFDRLRAMLKRQIEQEDMLLDREVDAYYIDFLAEYARYLRLHGRPTDSMSLLKMIQGFFGPKGKNNLTLDKQTYLENLTGVALLDLGRVEEAEERFKNILAQNKYDYDSHANLGMIYLKTGRLERAKTTLERAIELGPRYPEAYISLAQYYKRQGDRSRAREYYNLALKRALRSSLISMIKRELASLSAKKEGSP